MGKCEICNKEFEDKYFDIEQNKCILHCEKDDWYEIKDNQKEWNRKKVNKFWNYIQKDLDKKYSGYIIDSDLIDSNCIFENIIFPKFQNEEEYHPLVSNEHELGTNFYSFNVFEHHNNEQREEVNILFRTLTVSFDNCIFLDDANFEKYNFEHPILFNNCTFKNEIQLNKIYTDRVSFLACTMQNLNCQDIVFEQKVKIQNCEIKEKANFYNTKFKDLADFYRTKFNEVVFERADFEKIAVFSEAEFQQDIDFKYTKFLGKSIFRDTVIKGKLNLRNTIFDDEANFLDITSEERKKDKNEEYIGDTKNINVTNRETARIIKNFFDKSGNIIEANKFYALEMQKREEELSKKGNILKLLVFYFHSISSEHSQNWFLALLWILFLALFYTVSIINKEGVIFIYLVAVFVIVNTMINIYSNNKSIYKQREIVRIVAVILMVSSVCLAPGMRQSCSIYTDEFSELYFSNLTPFINPKIETITLSLVVYKVALSYLIYQFIVSVRQNTRRK